MPDQISEHYLGSAGQDYVAARQKNASHGGFAINLSYFTPYLNKNQIALDFGCGNGGMLRLLKDLVGRADGLEVNPVAAKMATDTGCTIYGRLEDIPAQPLYDVIVSNHVLEHVRDVCSLLEQLRLRLKPGGMFITKLPNDDIRAPHQQKWSRTDPDHHLQTWTPRLFANCLYESGFEVKECRVITSAWHPKLMFLPKLGIVGRFGAWLLAVALKRRQVFAVGVRKD